MRHTRGGVLADLESVGRAVAVKQHRALWDTNEVGGRTLLLLDVPATLCSQQVKEQLLLDLRPWAFNALSQHANVPLAMLQSLFFISTVQFLLQPRGEPAGPVHIDYQRHQRALAEDSYSFVVYFTAGDSTRFSTEWLRVHHLAAFAPGSAAVVQQRQLADESLYRSWPIAAGDYAIVNGCTPHQVPGVPASAAEPRLCCYFLVSRRHRAVQLQEVWRLPMQADADAEAARKYKKCHVPATPLAHTSILFSPVSRERSASACSPAPVFTLQNRASLTAEEKALMLAIVKQLADEHVMPSDDQAIKFVGRAAAISPRTLRNVQIEWQEHGVLCEPDTAQRGRGSPCHPLSPRNPDAEGVGPTLDEELLLHQLVAQVAAGSNVTSAGLASELQQELPRAKPVSASTVRRWLHALGYSWLRKCFVGGMKPAARAARMRQFILEYATALRDEEAGTAVCVYTDESFLHHHHNTKYGWLRKGCSSVAGDSDGRRLILLHAMTAFGLLAVPDAVGTNWMSEEAQTAEVVFEEVYEDGQDDSDYHNTMNGDKFTMWVRCRLLPAFTALHPGRRMVLIMDNASYHKARDASWVSSSAAQSKKELADQLIGRSVTHITTSDGRRVASHLFDTPACRKADLVAALNAWLEQHPGYNQTVVEKLLNDGGHSIVYTPPYTPEVQPIELLWARVKHSVASQATLNRSIAAVREQVEAAFEAVTKLDCNNLVKHCHDWIDDWLQSDDAGDLQQCRTLGGVIQHLDLLKVVQESHTPQSHGKPAAVSAAVAAPVASASSSTRPLRVRH
jgi:transposase